MKRTILFPGRNLRENVRAFRDQVREEGGGGLRSLRAEVVDEILTQMLDAEPHSRPVAPEITSLEAELQAMRRTG